MSTKPSDPEDIVSDGVDDDGKPVPRDTGTGGTALPQEAGASGASGGRVPGKSDAHKVPGPAEEQDEKAEDDRGLTTDTSPD